MKTQFDIPPIFYNTRYNRHYLLQTRTADRIDIVWLSKHKDLNYVRETDNVNRGWRRTPNTYGVTLRPDLPYGWSESIHVTDLNKHGFHVNGKPILVNSTTSVLTMLFK